MTGRRGERAGDTLGRGEVTPGSQGWLTPNVVALGVVSLLTDTASEMVIPLLPVFLTTVLGAGPLALGWIEGAADAVASVLKLVSGRWSDRSGRRRPFVLAGYTLSTVSRPLVAIAGTAWHVLAVRVVDRTGKGLRSSPRDALLAASVPAGQRGAAFGLHRAMDHAGAVLGPLIAFAVLTLWTQDLRTLFWLSAVPGGLAVVAIPTVVREAKPQGGVSAPSPHPTERPLPPGGLLRVLVPVGLFTLGNASDVFLLLKASESRASLTSLPLLWMGLHVVKSAASVPGGRLADVFGRRRLIAAGWIVYAAVYFGFAFAETQSAVWGLFIAYGLYHGLTEGAERALVAELVPAASRGTGFGWYHLTVGLGGLAASVLFGAIWKYAGSASAFVTSAALALVAVVALALLAPRVR
ncbi:MAG: MFS transporter [Myxococcales bacterium]|nr:MFS transporter [Myxococcales bacterium]